MEAHFTPCTVGFIRRALAGLPDDTPVIFSTVCFEPGKVPEYIRHTFVGGYIPGVREEISFDLCDKMEEDSGPGTTNP